MLKWLALFTIVTFGATEKIPPFVHLCKRYDPEFVSCFIKSLYEIVPYLRNGIPQMGLPPIDPLVLESVKFGDAALANLNLHGEIFNVTVYNVTVFEIRKYTVDLEKFNSTIEIYFPYMRILAKYKAKGKLLFFELDNSGNLELNISEHPLAAFRQTACVFTQFLGNVVANGGWSGTFVTKNIKKYGHLTTSSLKVKSGAKIRIRLGGLFKDNVDLTEIINAAINANIDSLFDDFVPLVEEALSQILINYFNLVYDKFSMDELYPPN